MSLRGTAFGNDAATGAYLTIDPGAIASLYNGGYTVMMLARSTTDQKGLFGGWADAVGGTQRGGLLIVVAKLFGINDFSSGSGAGLDDGDWRWYGYSKATGNAPYIMHIGEYTDLSWAHGPSVGAGDHGDTGSSAEFSVGFSVYGFGSNNGDWAACVAWPRQLTSGEIEAACTKTAQDLADSAPGMVLLAPEATAGSALVDLTGNGANESARQNMTTSADPPAFDFGFTPGGDAGAATRFMAFF